MVQQQIKQDQKMIEQILKVVQGCTETSLSLQQISASSQSDVQLIQNAFLLLKRIILTNPRGIQNFYKYPGLKKTLRSLLVDVEHARIQQIASQSIEEIAKQLD